MIFFKKKTDLDYKKIIYQKDKQINSLKKEIDRISKTLGDFMVKNIETENQLEYYKSENFRKDQ